MERRSRTDAENAMRTVIGAEAITLLSAIAVVALMNLVALI